MPPHAAPSPAGLFPRDSTVWPLALVVLAPLLVFGLTRQAFLPAALLAAVAAGAARKAFPQGRGARLADALSLAAMAFPLLALTGGVIAQGMDFAAGLVAPLTINPIEGREAYKAWLLALGGNLYAGPAHGPDIRITLYGPLYYVLAALAERLFGPGLLPARFVSLAAAAALLVAIFALVRRETDSKAAATVAACALFAAPLYEYGHFARPDMTAWAFFFLTAWAFCRALDTPRPARSLILAAFLAVCALLAKQQTWPPLFGLFLYGMLRRRMKATAAFAGITLVIGAAAFITIDAATGGGFLAQSFDFPRRMAGLTDLNTNAFALERLRVFASQRWPDLLLAAGLLLSAASTRRVTCFEPVLLACLAPLFVVLRWTGAEYNHFLPVIILAKAGGGVLLVRLWRLPRPAWLRASAAALVLALLATPPEAFAPHAARLVTDHAKHSERLAALRKDTDALPGPVLADAEAAYVFLGAPPRDVTAYDAFETNIFERLGLLRPETSTIAQGIRDRRFALALTTPTFQPKALTTLLELYYSPAPTTAGPTLWRPRPETAVLGVTAPEGQGHAASQAGVAIIAQAAGDLEAKAGYVTADGREGPGTFALDIRSDRPLASLGTTFFARLNRKEKAASLRLEAEDGAGARTVLWERNGGEGDGWDPEPGVRADVAVPEALAASTRRLVFTLRGPAQLWFGPARPLLVSADSR